jgi:hypothetical protein
MIIRYARYTPSRFHREANMSKEVAAAILTRVYFEHVPGANTNLDAHSDGVKLESVDKIGAVYAAFLGKYRVYRGWAATEFRPK